MDKVLLPPCVASWRSSFVVLKDVLAAQGSTWNAWAEPPSGKFRGGGKHRKVPHRPQPHLGPEAGERGLCAQCTDDEGWGAPPLSCTRALRTRAYAYDFPSKCPIIASMSSKVGARVPRPPGRHRSRTGAYAVVPLLGAPDQTQMSGRRTTS